MGRSFTKPGIEEIRARGSINASDVTLLRQEVFHDAIVASDEAGLLFELNDSCRSSAPEWREFFVEAITDYLVNQAAPYGYISEANADWLIRRISHDGKLEASAELELLVKIIEKASSSPASLIAFALGQVKEAVLQADEALFDGRKLVKGVLGEAEVDMLRRILYGFGSGGNMAITAGEAEVLFDLNDATVHEQNHPSWDELFVKAIASFLMAYSGYQPLSREQALKNENWLDERGSGKEFVSKMFASGLSGALNSVFSTMKDDSATAKNRAREKGIAMSERIDEDEADWLIKRIKRDGVLHENEKALLRFIRDESPDIHPKLKPLLEAVA